MLDVYDVFKLGSGCCSWYQLGATSGKLFQATTLPTTQADWPTYGLKWQWFAVPASAWKWKRGGGGVCLRLVEGEVAWSFVSSTCSLRCSCVLSIQIASNLLLPIINNKRLIGTIGEELQRRCHTIVVYLLALDEPNISFNYDEELSQHYLSRRMLLLLHIHRCVGFFYHTIYFCRSKEATEYSPLSQ